MEELLEESLVTADDRRHGLHYLLYDETKLLEKADDKDRPSLKIRNESNQHKNTKNALPSAKLVEKESVDLTSSIRMTHKTQNRWFTM